VAHLLSIVTFFWIAFFVSTMRIVSSLLKRAKRQKALNELCSQNEDLGVVHEAVIQLAEARLKKAGSV